MLSPQWISRKRSPPRWPSCLAGRAYLLMTVVLATAEPRAFRRYEAGLSLANSFQVQPRFRRAFPPHGL